MRKGIRLSSKGLGFNTHDLGYRMCECKESINETDLSLNVILAGR